MTARELEQLFMEMIKTTDEYFHGAVSDNWLLEKKPKPNKQTNKKTGLI